MIEIGFVRANETMNSESPHDFRWSVRLTAGFTHIGIATETPKDSKLKHYAITYEPYNGKIYEGFQMLKNDISEAINGDEIHFRFQSKLKKFSISFVSSIIFDCFYLEF